jgi:MFS family permease
LVFGVVAGFCIACLTVAGNTYVARTVSDDIRGRVFTAMESVIRVSLLLSMVVVAPLADLLGALVARLSAGMTDPSWFTGPRITLQIASLIVLGAAYYAYRTLNWRMAEHTSQFEAVRQAEQPTRVELLPRPCETQLREPGVLLKEGEPVCAEPDDE